MSPAEIKDNKLDNKLSSASWITNAAVIFEVAPEVVSAAIGEGTYSKSEVAELVKKYLETPVTRGS